MRTVFALSILFLLMFWPGSDVVRADVNVGMSVDEDGIKGFYLAIGEHYTVPEKEIVYVRKKNIPDDDLPVVFYLASRSGVSSKRIIELRLSGKSWMEITLHLGLHAGIFHVPFNGDPGPPYGKAYGHFKNKPKKKWREIHFVDVDIVNLVNLRFMSNYYGCSPEFVVKMRKQGKSFTAINAEAKKQKKQKLEKSKMASKEKSKSKGKGKKK
jgi:hypothetical protein